MKKNILSSTSLLVVSAAIVIMQLVSCKKNDAAPEKNSPITGLWEGTYQTDQVKHDPTYMSFTVFPDGSIVRKAKVVGQNDYGYFKGSWKLTGNKFEFKDTTLSYSGGYSVCVCSLTFNSNAGTLTSGTWQATTNGQSTSGTFQNMTRNN